MPFLMWYNVVYFNVGLFESKNRDYQSNSSCYIAVSIVGIYFMTVKKN